MGNPALVVAAPATPAAGGIAKPPAAGAGLLKEKPWAGAVAVVGAAKLKMKAMIFGVELDVSRRNLAR
jgi:hypothetical protein